MILKILKKIDSKTLDTTKEKIILLLSREFIDLKIKKITRQELRPHQFKLNKQEIAKVLTIKNKKTYLN